MHAMRASVPLRTIERRDTLTPTLLKVLQTDFPRGRLRAMRFSVGPRLADPTRAPDRGHMTSVRYFAWHFQRCCGRGDGQRWQAFAALAPPTTRTLG
jgi:hypothetical protein